jgi:hypothetical protein
MDVLRFLVSTISVTLPHLPQSSSKAIFVLWKSSTTSIFEISPFSIRVSNPLNISIRGSLYGTSVSPKPKSVSFVGVAVVSFEDRFLLPVPLLVP